MAFALFVALLIGLPVLAGQAQGWALADSFYRAGSLVFGGGHVVLPLLQAETVAPGWVFRVCLPRRAMATGGLDGAGR
jgi:chromate transporter